MAVAFISYLKKKTTIQEKNYQKSNPIPKIMQEFLQNTKGYWTQYPFSPVHQSNKKQPRLLFTDIYEVCVHIRLPKHVYLHIRYDNY